MFGRLLFRATHEPYSDIYFIINIRRRFSQCKPCLLAVSYLSVRVILVVVLIILPVPLDVVVKSLNDVVAAGS